MLTPGRAMYPLHANFTGTRTNLFELKGNKPQDVHICIADQGANADGVYYPQHLDYTTEDSPAWVDLSDSDDAITANADGSIYRVLRDLPPGLYCLNTGSETGTVDIFFWASNFTLEGLTDPTS